MNSFKEKIAIKSYHTNKFGQASFTSILNILIEAAWAHAQVMDWGYDNLKSNNLIWVLSRLYLKAEKIPVWQDQIILNTWSAGTDGMYAYREYLIEDLNGNVILTASTAWLILDFESRKIFRLSEYRNTFPKSSNPVICRNPKRIKPEKHVDEIIYLPVNYSDIDVNQHFNSVKYVERIFDFYGIDFLNIYEPLEFEVNYIKEGQIGDKVGVSSFKLGDNEFLNCVVRESDGADLCAIRIVWKKRV